MTTTPVRSTVHSPARRPQAACSPSVLQGTPATATSSVRLTRRGRVVLLVLLVTAVLALLSASRPGAHAATTPDRATTATVQSGDSLWSLARRELPGTDPRQAVTQIQLLNHLDGSVVQAGQQLLLPAS